jgi:hypothetical protein
MPTLETKLLPFPLSLRMIIKEDKFGVTEQVFFCQDNKLIQET